MDNCLGYMGKYPGYMGKYPGYMGKYPGYQSSGRIVIEGYNTYLWLKSTRWCTTPPL